MSQSPSGCRCQTARSYLSDYDAVERSMRSDGGRWNAEFFKKWADLIETHTGVNTDQERRGFNLTREELASLAHVTAIRLRM